MQIVHEVTETAAATGKLFNAAHVYSSLNRKMIAPVDSQGNAQLFGLRVQVYSAAANTVTLSTASNSYVTKQAIKSWFKVWKKSHSDSGISPNDLGAYGRVFKPRLEATFSGFGSGGELGRGEWNYSDMVVPAPSTAGGSAVTGGNIYDQYSMHILGSSVAAATNPTQLWDSVGLVESWLGSRRSTTGSEGAASGDVVSGSGIIDDNNPLRQARGKGVHSEILMDEVRDLQADLPPYDNQDFTSAYTQALVKTDANLSAAADIVAPCGLVKVSTTAACTVLFTLVGITDM